MHGNMNVKLITLCMCIVYEEEEALIDFI